MSESFLPYGRHWIDEDDIAAVAECLRGDWLTTGPAVEAFEAAFSEVVGARYAVVVSNGTVALHLAALAAQVGANDIGIAPTMSFLASANGMRYTGAQIVFADADPGTGLVTPETFQAAIKRAARQVKMAVVVHLNGNPVDMPEIARIADEHDIVLVEDACHALGTIYRDESGVAVKVGACRHSAMTVFSLHPVKTITMGEGGVVTTNNPILYERLKLLRSHGMVRTPEKIVNSDLGFARSGDVNPWYYEMQELGFNYRAPDFTCVLAHSQLKKLSLFAERRAQLKEIYDRYFGDIGELVKPLRVEASAEPVLHLYPLLIDFGALGKERARVMVDLRERGIGTQVHYIPIHRQPYYVEQSGVVDLPGADSYYTRALSIPYYPLMSDHDAERVAIGIRSVLSINTSKNSRNLMLSGSARLGIGTAQFGLAYGVTNQAGKVEAKEAASILHVARQNGVRTIDTAALYGDSEATIGQAAARGAFDVVTKTVKVGSEPTADGAVDAIVSRFERSIHDLRVSHVDALMVHDAGDLLGRHGDRIWRCLQDIKTSGLARKVGASLYSDTDIDTLLARYDVDIVQLPFNAVDLRLLDGGQLNTLATRKVEIHARSIFLQGLLLLPPEQLPRKFAALAPSLTQMRQTFARAELTVMEGLFASVFRHPMIDRVIVGAASLGEFQEIVLTVNRLNTSQIDIDSWRWPISDERLLNPASWESL